MAYWKFESREYLFYLYICFQKRRQSILPGIRREKNKKQRVSGIIRICGMTKIKRDEL